MSSQQKVEFVPIRIIRWNYNLKHPPFRKHEQRLERSITQYGLKHALEVTHGKRRNELEGLEGWTRSRVIERLHKKRRTIRYRPTGQIIPLGKVPVIGTETAVDPVESRFIAIRSNLERRRIHPLELGHQFTELIAAMGILKYGQKVDAINRIADECGRKETWVYRRLEAWQGLSQKDKDNWLGTSKHKVKMSLGNYYEASKPKTEAARTVLAKKIEGQPHAKARIMTKAVLELEKRYPDAAPTTKKEATAFVEHAIKLVAKSQPVIAFDNLADMPLMKNAEVVIRLNSIVCPGGKVLTHVPCPPEGCKGCPHKGTEIELKSDSVKANLSFAAPTNLYQQTILALAEDIKLKRALVAETVKA